MNGNTPQAWNGKRPPSMSAEELKGSVQRAVKRANRSKRYQKITVLMVTWDYDGGMHLLENSQDLEAVFVDQYNYKIVRVTLSSGKDRKIGSDARGTQASLELQVALYDVLRDHSTEDDLIIFHYRGHGVIDETMPDRHFLASGEFVDPGGNHDKTITRVNFQQAAESLLKPNKAEIVILIDSCAAGRAVFDHKHSLLAATSATSTSQSRETGFGRNLVELFQQAESKRDWLTMGILHSALLGRVGTGTLTSIPVWQAAQTKEYVIGSPMFHKVEPELQEALQPISGNQRKKLIAKENQNSLKNRPKPMYIKLAVRLSDTDLNTVSRFSDWVETCPVDDDTELELIAISNQRLGAGGKADPGMSLMFEFHIDVLVWRELDSEDHDAMLFCGIYPSLPETNILRQASRKVSNTFVETVTALGNLSKRRKLRNVSPEPSAVPRSITPQGFRVGSTVRKVSDTVKNLAEQIMHPTADVAGDFPTRREGRIEARNRKENERPVASDTPTSAIAPLSSRRSRPLADFLKAGPSTTPSKLPR